MVTFKDNNQQKRSESSKQKYQKNEGHSASENKNENHGQTAKQKSQNTQVALRYERGGVASNHTVRLVFQLLHDKDKTKCEVQKHIGSSSEEFFKTLREMGNLVKNNDLLPENFPTTGAGKAKKRASAFILPRLPKLATVDTSTTSQQQAAVQSKINEYDRYKSCEKMNRLEVFWGYEKIFATKNTYKSLTKTMTINQARKE